MSGPASQRGGRGRQRQLRQPHVAEVLADRLRERILSGRLPGDRLPPQEDLLREFGVSRQSLREALRILETDGLVAVHRGNVGGLTVHQPTFETVARTLGMALQSRAVVLSDVGQAIRLVEPLCAELCASRPDRSVAVVPELRRLQVAAETSVDSSVTVDALSRQFHETLVRNCGNETLIFIAGALEELWSRHEEAWAQRAVTAGVFPPRPKRLEALHEHALLIDLIAAGDAAAAGRHARDHLATAQLYTLSDADNQQVTVTGEIRTDPPPHRHPGPDPATP